MQVSVKRNPVVRDMIRNPNRSSGRHAVKHRLEEHRRAEALREIREVQR